MTNPTQNEQIVIKYLRDTKYDQYMFEVISLPSSDECYFKIKEFRSRKYVYLPKKRVKCDTTLQRDCYYAVNAKIWVVKHLAMVMKHFTLVLTDKPIETCNINTDSDSDQFGLINTGKHTVIITETFTKKITR